MWDVLFKKNLLTALCKRLKEKNGLMPFVRKRRHFEGWLQVELCKILENKEIDIIPEHPATNTKGIDIVLVSREDRHKCAIELKVIPSRVVCDKLDPIKSLVSGGTVAKDLGPVGGVLKDIEKLGSLGPEFRTRMVIFFVYPVNPNTEKTDKDNTWIIENNPAPAAEDYFNTIIKKMELQEGKPFLKEVVNFNNIKGIIFLGTIRMQV